MLFVKRYEIEKGIQQKVELRQKTKHSVMPYLGETTYFSSRKSNKHFEYNPSV